MMDWLLELIEAKLPWTEALDDEGLAPFQAAWPSGDEVVIALGSRGWRIWDSSWGVEAPPRDLSVVEAFLLVGKPHRTALLTSSESWIEAHSSEARWASGTFEPTRPKSRDVRCVPPVRTCATCGHHGVSR